MFASRLRSVVRSFHWELRGGWGTLILRRKHQPLGSSWGMRTISGIRRLLPRLLRTSFINVKMGKRWVFCNLICCSQSLILFIVDFIGETECRFLSRVTYRGSRVEGRGSRVEGRGSRVEGRGSRVEGRGSRVEGRGSRVEGRGSRVEGRGSRVEGRGSRVEVRGSRVEGRGSRFEGRGSRVEGRGSRVEGRGSRVEGRGSRVEGGKKSKKVISYPILNY